MSDWSPGNYLKFRNERTQPSIDLVGRIKINDPQTIIDIGCGPGNSTQILALKWPDADIIGLDSSESMIAQAKNDFPKLNWVYGKAEEINNDKKYTVVFSNAALQWMPNHEKLIPKLWDIIENDGVFAAQIPAFEKMDISVAIKTVLEKEKWIKCKIVETNIQIYNGLDYYYELLCGKTNTIELWETHYYHIMSSWESIIDFIEATALRPYLNELKDEEKTKFKKEILEELKKYYKKQTNEKILFPFKRTFIIAYKN
jgi:trans-aconitate 2-methyltransferase